MKKILIVRSKYNNTTALLNSAVKVLKKRKINYSIISVNGAFEIPVALARKIKKFDGFIALGIIIKGKTPNFNFISQAITNGLIELAILSKKPIGNGILTCLNIKQVRKREHKGKEAAEATLDILKLWDYMNQKLTKNITSPRIRIIQKIYGSLMNPDEKIVYPKNQFKKYIKDVVSGTLERTEFIEETINNHLEKDIDLKKTDKLLKIILFSAVFELLFKHNTPKNVVISEYVRASEFFLEKAQISYLNAILDKLSKLIRKAD